METSDHLTLRWQVPLWQGEGTGLMLWLPMIFSLITSSTQTHVPRCCLCSVTSQGRCSWLEDPRRSVPAAHSRGKKRGLQACKVMLECSQGVSVATTSYHGYNEQLAEDAEHLSGTALRRIAGTGKWLEKRFRGQEYKQLVELPE